MKKEPQEILETRFWEAYSKVSDGSKTQLLTDILANGAAFIRVTNGGEIERVSPSEVLPAPDDEGAE